MSTNNKEATLLTGGTGFLGSYIGAELLRKGEPVYFLIRKDTANTPIERLHKILDWHGINQDMRKNSLLIKGELGAPGLGMDPGESRQAVQSISRIIHCASNTSFSERKRKEVWKTNVSDLKGLMDFAAKTRCRRFIYLSSVYSAGCRIKPCKEEFPTGNKFFNCYEESKSTGENYLKRRCREEKIPLIIIRPSIVYGDSRTGKTLRFNALYYPIKAALLLKKIYKEDILLHGGKKAAAAGVKIKSDGKLLFPLRIAVKKKAGVNLVPVDFFVRAFFAVLENIKSEGIFHIVNPTLTKIEDIIDFASRQFKFEGIRACKSEDFNKESRNLLERLFEQYIDAYSPYLRDTRIFLAEKTTPILEESGIICPEFNETIFRRCMSYAESHGWS